MRGFAAHKVFSAAEILAYEQARDIVAKLPDHPDLRCHEVARIVHAVLGVGEVEDGKYQNNSGASLPIEHSWIAIFSGKRRYLRVLDTYSIGQLPVVQLVDVEFPLANPYFAGPPRADIRQPLIDEMIALVR